MSVRWVDDKAVCLGSSVVKQGSAEDNAVQAIYDLYSPQSGLLSIKTFINLDASDDSKLVPNGMVAIHPADTPVHADSLVDYQYHMVFPISRNGSKKFTDADFTNDEIRQRLNEAVPQFSDRPPSLELRNRIDNGDLDVWEAELGQDRAFAGIYKQISANGRDATYAIHVLAGAENINSELKSWINKMPVDKKITWGEFLDSDEASYARAIAENNCKRIGYAVARACRVTVPHIVDEMSNAADDASYGKTTRAEPKVCQPVSTMARYPYPQRPAVAVYSGVTPANQCRSTFIASGSAYDPITVFNLETDGAVDNLGMPAVSARQTPADGLDHSKLTPEEAKERVSHLLWEGTLKNDAIVHPDAHPDAFHSPTNETFLEAMVTHGWQRKHMFSQAVPVVVKISNPDLKRK